MKRRSAKRVYLRLLVILLAVIGIFTSCQKDDNDDPVAEYGVPSAKFIEINN